MLFGLDGVADSGYRFNEAVKVQRFGEEETDVVFGVAVVVMKGDVVHIVIGMFQNGGFPAAEGGHSQVGAAAGHQFNGGIHPLHDLGGFSGDPSIFFGGFGADLPGAVHLVAQAPGFDVERLFKAIGSPFVAIQGTAGEVTVFHQIPGFFGSSGTQVYGHHHLRAGPFGPFLKLIDTHLVGFNHFPGQFQPPGALVFGTSAVFPAIAGYKVTAGIPDDGNLELAYQIQYVLPEAHVIGSGVIRLINAAVDRPSQMFNKGTVDAVVNSADLVVLSQFHGCVHEKTSL